jgi:hypothetical protein
MRLSAAVTGGAVKRLPPPLEEPGGRSDCVCPFAPVQIAAFIHGIG